MQTPNLTTLRQQIATYSPFNDQEERDRALILRSLDTFTDVLTRENPLCHFTASCWITNPQHDKILMAFHNIYQTWAWAGGHADGNPDLLHVAEKEAREETSLVHLRPLSDDIFSLQVIPVSHHYKRDQFVSSHLHLDCCFLFEANDTDSLHSKPDENSGVRWFPLSEAVTARAEPFMQDIYRKLNQKLTSSSYSSANCEL